MKYRQVIFYVMSGTGNSRRVALWMQQAAMREGVSCCVRPFESATPAGDIAGEDSELVGLVFPAHGFTAPWAMLKFAWRLPRRRSHACVVATRGGSMIGRLRLPGMEGTACYLIALLLALKGYRVRGTQAFDMPSNWTVLHWGMSEEHVAAILAQAQPKAEAFMARLLSGQRHFSGYLSLAIGLALSRISCMYLLIGRMLLAKLFFANTACNGCGVCARACPVHAIRMFGIRQPRPYWTFTCESCLRCMNYCPNKAVEGGQSWAV